MSIKGGYSNIYDKKVNQINRDGNNRFRQGEKIWFPDLEFKPGTDFAEINRRCISISTTSPDIIKNAVKEILDVSVIVGARVKTGEDIKIALKLGAKGVWVASGITKAADPRKVLEKFAIALKGYN